MINSDSMSPIQSFKRIWKNYGREHLFSFIIANLFMILIAGTTALYPIVIDYAFLSLEEANWSKIIFIPVFIILLTFIKGAALYKQTVIINTLVQTIIFKIQSSLFNSLLKLDLDVINAIRVGNLQARIMNDVNLMKEALIRSFNNLVRDLFTLIGLIISMFWLNWTLALAVIIVYPLAVFPIVKIGKRSFIGANSVVKQGISIGKDVTIGAGSVIINNVPDNATVVGNPGKIIKIKKI